MERTLKGYINYNWRLILFVTLFFVLAAGISPVYAKYPLLIIRTEGKDFEQAVQGLREEVEEECFLSELIISKNDSIYRIEREMKNILPKLVILMDNISISLYKSYQKSLPDSAYIVPSISIMASFMDMAVKGMKNAAGISYEVPIVTSMVNLRSILSSIPLDKVGIVHRAFMSESVKLNRKYCEKEDMRLIAYKISDRGSIESELKRGLDWLNKKAGIDVLCVPNDSKIVTAQMLKSVWIPFAIKFRKPIIVGVEVLVQPRFKFGTFAVTPDHVQLGTQAAEIIFDTMDNNWQIQEKIIEPPRSVYKVINLEQAEGLFNVDKEKLMNVDRILR